MKVPYQKQMMTLNCVHLISWDQDGRGRLADSVVTTMVTKVMTSCLDLVWLRRALKLSASHGGSMETANMASNMRMIHVPLTPKEVYTQHAVQTDAHTVRDGWDIGLI